LTAAVDPLLAVCLPLDEADVHFAEPWEAKAFAIVVQMSAAGHFSWAEWVDCFSREVKAAAALEALSWASSSISVSFTKASKAVRFSK